MLMDVISFKKWKLTFINVYEPLLLLFFPGINFSQIYKTYKLFYIDSSLSRGITAQIREGLFIH